MICSPLTQICATPSQPLLPYLPLQISTLPFAGLQFFLDAPPATTAVFRTVDLLQSLEVVSREGSQLFERLSPRLSVNGFDDRAQC